LEAPDLGNEDGVMPHEMSPGKPSTRRYSRAEKDRAVRAVRQLRKELGTDHGTIKRVADQLGIGVESLWSWVKQAEIDDGVKPGVTSAEAARIKELEQELKELRRANAILRSASAFFAAELDRPQR
jgi:transposase